MYKQCALSIDTMAENNTSRTAPFYSVPSRRIVSIEHPAIIKNVDKAIDTLQGKTGIIKVCSPTSSRDHSDSILGSRPAQGGYPGKPCASARGRNVKTNAVYKLGVE